MNLLEDPEFYFLPLLPPGGHRTLTDRYIDHGPTYYARAKQLTFKPFRNPFVLNGWGESEIYYYRSAHPELYDYADYAPFLFVNNPRKQPPVLFILRRDEEPVGGYTEHELFQARYWAWVIGVMIQVRLANMLYSWKHFGFRGRKPNISR